GGAGARDGEADQAVPGVQVVGKDPLGVQHCVSSRLSKKTPRPPGGDVRGGGTTPWRSRFIA
ncbi:conserved hypothetical protein, partial [Ricinus communis]